MIKIIKEGKKQPFRTTCPDCGCEFEYEVDDLFVEANLCLTTYPATYDRCVKCPCCNRKIHHDYVRENQYTGDIPYILTVNKLYSNEHPNGCENCAYKDGPKDAFGNPTVGDSPCQWCPHYKWKMTCANGNSNK